MERLTDYEKIAGHAHAIPKMDVDADKAMARLAEIEDILGDEYDLEHLRKLVNSDRDERCFTLPAKIGDTVYHITKCKGFAKVLDGTMHGDNGEPGTATGWYCPCELAENCPFPCDDDGEFDCYYHNDTLAIFEDVVTAIHIDEDQEFILLEYSGAVDFDDFGKSVFLNRDAAEIALKSLED